ncbi:hypothetical protein EJ03DRAFT_371765 [Teratosphaeria nubilosa]|uniref:Uncharacterized protein n=1 Tax=Teratosphaeria nubilosa TaxID=161662 RepID=A0A6G1LKA4_9PEZI|nr:hypothetical protein EJ03DRAFT_371765 [Teratosphaeria nubilosa]
MARKSFLDLPPELRNHIYVLAMVEDVPTRADIYKHTVWVGDEAISQVRCIPSSPQLAYVSKQLREESLAVFFGLNTFSFFVSSAQAHTNSTLSQWAAKLPVPPSSIKRVKLSFRVLACIKPSSGSSLPVDPLWIDEMTLTATEGPEPQFEITFGKDQDSVLRRECTCRLESCIRGPMRNDGTETVLDVAKSATQCLAALNDEHTRGLMAHWGDFCGDCLKEKFDSALSFT